MPTITFNPVENPQQAEEKILGKKPSESLNMQKSEEEISLISSQQRDVVEDFGERLIKCPSLLKQLVGTPEERFSAPPFKSVNTNVQIIEGERYKENRPKTSAFGELPLPNKVIMPVDFSTKRAFAHPLVITRFEIMNKDWLTFANGLLLSGEKITSVKKTRETEEDADGNTKTVVKYKNIKVNKVQNIKMSSCYRAGPSDPDWRSKWILDKNQHKSRLQREANGNPKQFSGIRSGNKIDLSKSELHKRFKNRFKNIRPSTVADKEYLFDGYLKDRYGSAKTGRRKLAFISVHNSGLAFDIRSNGLSSESDATTQQKNTTLFKWLKENAHKYGFTPYKVEPWHWELLPPRASYFTAIDYVQDKNYNVRVVEQGVLTGLSTSRRDESSNRPREDDRKNPQQYSFLKELRTTKEGVA